MNQTTLTPTEMPETQIKEWRCPYCDSTTGEPVTVYSREFQGEAGHGGMVEWADEMCSECTGREPDPEPEYWPEIDDGYYAAGDDAFTNQFEES
jgi:hypothetical protein